MVEGIRLVVQSSLKQGAEPDGAHGWTVLYGAVASAGRQMQQPHPITPIPASVNPCSELGVKGCASGGADDADEQERQDKL